MDSVQKLKQVVPRALWPYLGAVRRVVRSLPPRTQSQKRRMLAEDTSLAPAERELLARADSRIHPDDGMYKGDGAHYFHVGLDALRRIDEALASAGIDDVRKILDMPCGYGRVLRLLVQRFPRAEVTACELERGAVEFCVRRFGATPAHSSTDLDALSLGERYDLIWCGSLATHLSERPLLALLRFFRRHLAPGGLLLFTTHGDFVARRLPTRDFDYGLADEQIDALVARYPADGFAYTDYPDRESYGISLAAPAWVRARVGELGGMREVYFKERGWDRHQDVYGFVLDESADSSTEASADSSTASNGRRP
ncbi:MAG TPA: methyltransferase [Pyrinomonadaceae bacterium]|nr:methyltransferase [Pyrinomonadaceae bacterium]